MDILTTYVTKEEDNEILDKISNFLRFDFPNFSTDNLTEKVQELCVAKLCKTIGIRCAYNYKNVFFDFFSSIMGEAISQKLNLNLTVDKNNFKFLKFGNVNLINKACAILESKDIDEAFIDVYDFADDYKWVIDVMKKV